MKGSRPDDAADNKYRLELDQLIALEAKLFGHATVRRHCLRMLATFKSLQSGGATLWRRLG